MSWKCVTEISTEETTGCARQPAAEDEIKDLTLVRVDTLVSERLATRGR